MLWKPAPFVLCGLCLLSLLSLPLSGRAEAPPKRPRILDERPCGPDSIRGPLRYLFFQGCVGADFREACRRHDACYDTIGSDRRACDKRFLQDMLAECPKSKHPARARYRAHFAYLGVKFGGKGAWKSAQELARKLIAD
ncbi:MAG: hypothetical protein JNJ70_08970 [Verrucomicrobiales bacterium]|nr:hypothetical protein [Verrucomicrobiales bacterium]